MEREEKIELLRALMEKSIYKDGTDIREALSYSLCESIHENWRRSLIKDGEAYVPQVEITSDNGWIKKNGSEEVDLGIIPFEKVPSDLQAPRIDRARKLIDSVYSKIMVNAGLSQEDRMSICMANYKGDEVNTFENLPLEEQDQSMQNIDAAVDTIIAYKEGRIDINSLQDKYEIDTREEEK